MRRCRCCTDKYKEWLGYFYVKYLVLIADKGEKKTTRSNVNFACSTSKLCTLDIHFLNEGYRKVVKVYVLLPSYDNLRGRRREGAELP